MTNSNHNTPVLIDAPIESAFHLYFIPLPLTYNNGQVIERDKLLYLLNKLTSFGGLTLLEIGVGLWIGPGNVMYRDPILPLLVMARSEEEILQWFANFGLEIAVLLEQEQTYIMRLPAMPITSFNPSLGLADGRKTVDLT